MTAQVYPLAIEPDPQRAPSSLDRPDAGQVGAERSDGMLVGHLDQKVERRSPDADRLGTEGPARPATAGSARSEAAGRSSQIRSS